MLLRLSAGLAIVLAVCDFAAAAEPSNWTQWRGNGRDSQLTGASLPESLEGNLELVWEKKHQPSYSGPITMDGLLYTTETVDKKMERVTAYRLDTGEVVWTTQWEGSMSVPFIAAANGDWIRATPAVTEAGLIVVGMRDVMYCLDPKTGETNWSVDFPKDMGTQLPAFGGCLFAADRR